jgi:hypothetical protein
MAYMTTENFENLTIEELAMCLGLHKRNNHSSPELESVINSKTEEEVLSAYRSTQDHAHKSALREYMEESERFQEFEIREPPEDTQKPKGGEQPPDENGYILFP